MSSLVKCQRWALRHQVMMFTFNACILSDSVHKWYSYILRPVLDKGGTMLCTHLHYRSNSSWFHKIGKNQWLDRFLKTTNTKWNRKAFQLNVKCLFADNLLLGMSWSPVRVGWGGLGGPVEKGSKAGTLYRGGTSNWNPVLRRAGSHNIRTHDWKQYLPPNLVGRR